jgi:hypothetical protein
MVNPVNATIRAALLIILKANYWYLISLGVAGEVAIKVVFLRILGLLLGLADTGKNMKAHNVVYNDVKVKDIGVLQNKGNPDSRILVYKGPDGKDVTVNPYLDDIPGWSEASEVAWRGRAKKKFTNMVCIVAFFFRTRGHHYLPDFDDRYKAIWRKCLYDDDTIGIPWKDFATTTIHYVYPDVLDKFWRDSCEAERCAGALIKRLDSYAAGTAAVGAVWAGYVDLIILFPKFRESVREGVAELERCQQVLDGSRWAGSVNRRFYGAENLVVKEHLLAALAATIIQGLKNAAGSTVLKNSNALMRVATGAPITGTFMAGILAKAAAHDDMVYAILPDPESVD